MIKCLIYSQPGSSPRVRGAARAVRPGRQAVGIIPARAGSRRLHRPHGRRQGDHPRACGEQSRYDMPTIREQGSSPRVRGAGVRQGA